MGNRPESDDTNLFESFISGSICSFLLSLLFPFDDAKLRQQLFYLFLSTGAFNACRQSTSTALTSTWPFGSVFYSSLAGAGYLKRSPLGHLH